MFLLKSKKRTHYFFKCLYSVLIIIFVCSSIVPSVGMAQGAGMLSLPVPGTMVVQSSAFVPVLLKGITIHPENPLKFDFIIDSGNTNFSSEEIEAEGAKMVKYFLASMTVPKDDLWVNLSPYENDRIIPEELGKTNLGRDLLAQDYLLKQLTASLMYPENDLGKEFWKKIYERAEAEYGTTDIPVDTFNKVWILPESATVYESGQTVYVVESKLKVMLDSDYMAMREGNSSLHSDSTMEIGESIIREVIIPEIEKEVNVGKNFATLRQIYHSLILAKWYKEAITDSLLSHVYVDQNKVEGVAIDDDSYKDEIYNQYMAAYNQGVFDLIKEEYDELSQELIPRKYFSGGIRDADISIGKTDSAMMVERSVVGRNFTLAVAVEAQQSLEGEIYDEAMLSRDNAGNEYDLGTNRLYEAIEALVKEQVEAGVAVPFSREGNLAAYYDNIERGIYEVQVNPRRHPENRTVLARGKKGCFLCVNNQPDAEKGISFGDYTVFANPSPYEKNHIVLVAKERETEDHPRQLLNSRSHVKVAFDVLDRVISEGGNYDYNLTFNSTGAANSSEHFHWQGFEMGMPIANLKKTLINRGGINIGFIDRYPGNAIYLQGENKDEVVDELLKISERMNTAIDGDLLAYNIRLRKHDTLGYEVYIFPRNYETPSAGKDGLISNKFGVVEMGGIIITYEELSGDDPEGVFVDSETDEYVQITKELIDDSIRIASFGDKELLMDTVLELSQEEKEQLSINKSSVIMVAGGSGVGKGTTISAVKSALGDNSFTLSAGIIYRAVAYLIAKGVILDPTDSEEVRDALEYDLEAFFGEDNSVRFRYQGEDITDDIRKNLDIEDILKQHDKNLHVEIWKFWESFIENKVSEGMDVVLDMRPILMDELSYEGQMRVYLHAPQRKIAERFLDQELISKKGMSLKDAYLSEVDGADIEKYERIYDRGGELEVREEILNYVVKHYEERDAKAEEDGQKVSNKSIVQDIMDNWKEAIVVDTSLFEGEPEKLAQEIILANNGEWSESKKESHFKRLIVEAYGEEEGLQRFDSFMDEKNDRAMLKDKVGGIDMNSISVNRKGSGLDVQFSYDAFAPMINNGVEGFVPVIINLTPLNSLILYLGLESGVEGQESFI